MKMREPHIVPLSRQAADILREVRPLTGSGRWVFPQMCNPDRPMSESCITAALRAMGYAGTEMSWHGFRALASTQLHQRGWNDRWIETQLSHADRNKIRASYNQGLRRYSLWRVRRRVTRIHLGAPGSVRACRSGEWLRENEAFYAGHGVASSAIGIVTADGSIQYSAATSAVSSSSFSRSALAVSPAAARAALRSTVRRWDAERVLSLCPHLHAIYGS